MSMKRKLFICSCVCLLLFGAAFAESGKFNVGVDAGINMNSPRNYAFEAGIHGYYNIFPFLSAGADVSVSMNFRSVFSLHTTAGCRYYIVSVTDNRSEGLFVQADAGWQGIWDDSVMYSVFSGGGRFGWRFGFNSFYTDVYVKAGYPYLWGAGAGFGFRF